MGQALLTATAPGQTTLLPGPFRQRFEVNRCYVASLASENLQRLSLGGLALGLDSLTCELRGYILGHWLSAAAHPVAQTGDVELGAKAAHIISKLARCQEANGGEWVGPFPEKYLHRIAAGKAVWAPQYTLYTRQC